MKQMKNELEAEVLGGNLSREAADSMLVEWTKSYNQKTKTARTCGWMCFLMNKKQTKRTMIENHKKRNVQVAPQMRSPLKVPSYPAGYQHGEEVSFSATTSVDLHDENEHAEPQQQAYYQQEYQEQEQEFPRKKMSKKEGKLLRQKSKLKFKFGNWEKLWDDHYQCDFYFNVDTEESQWEKPDDYVEDVELDMP